MGLFLAYSWVDLPVTVIGETGVTLYNASAQAGDFVTNKTARIEHAYGARPYNKIAKKSAPLLDGKQKVSGTQFLILTEALKNYDTLRAIQDLKLNQGSTTESTELGK
jgi:hypothetical protein